MTKESASSSKSFWEFPWGYPHAFLIAASVFINGILLQTVSKTQEVKIPPWPASGITIGVLGIFTVILAHLSYRKSALQKIIIFLASGPMTIATMSYLGFLAMLAGLIPQSPQGFWIQNITSSWPFALEILLMLIILGLATVRKLMIFKPSLKNFAFISNHLGMWFLVASMAAGSADLIKVRMYLEEGTQTSKAYNVDDVNLSAPVFMPFAISLHKFIIEEYANKAPKLYRSEVEIVTKNSKNLAAVIEVNKPLTVLNGYKIYQSSFEPGAREGSFVSIFEIVKDPWMVVVYLGAIMMLIGSTLLFWTGVKRTPGESQK